MFSTKFRPFLLALAALALIAGARPSEAADIGIFDELTDDRVEIFFSFAPLPPGGPFALTLGLPSGLFQGSYSGCHFRLFDEGGLISDATISSIFGCQGVWWSDGTPNPQLIDGNVDLSGLAAGETGRMSFRPLFNPGPPGLVSLNSPGISLGGASVTILSQSIVPEPSVATLLLAGLVALASRRARSRG